MTISSIFQASFVPHFLNRGFAHLFIHTLVNGIFSIIFKLVIGMKYKVAIDVLAINLVTDHLTELFHGS